MEVEVKCPSSATHWPQYHLQPHPPFISGIFFETDVACEFSNDQRIPCTLCSTVKSLALSKARPYSNTKALELALVVALSSLLATATSKIRSKVLLLGIIMYLEL